MVELGIDSSVNVKIVETLTFDVLDGSIHRIDDCVIKNTKGSNGSEGNESQNQGNTSRSVGPWYWGNRGAGSLGRFLKVEATLSAAQIPVAANVKCTSLDTPLGGPVSSISWSSAPVINGSSVSYKLVGKQQLSDPEWLKILAPTTIPVEFKTGLLGGISNTILMLLLGNGSEFHVGVVVVHSFGGVEWESAVAPAGRVVKDQGGTLNLISGFKCQP